MSLVTLIIPIYNTEKFIEKCLTSVCEQTLKDFELLLIDDLSQDNSLKVAKSILEKYPLRLQNTKIVELEKNIGIGEVRKLSISMVKGKYITFLDSDDYLESNALETMLSMMESNQADVIYCDYLTEKDRNTEYNKQLNITNKYDFIKGLLLNKIHGSLCTKMYKRALFDNVVFLEKMSNQEDLILNIQIGFFAEKIIYINQAFLHYVFHSDSITNSRNLEKIHKNIDDIIKAMSFIKSFLIKNKIYTKLSPYFYYRNILAKLVILKKKIEILIGK